MTVLFWAEEKEYFFFLLRPGFPRVLFRLFPRILGAWRVIDKNLSCALSGKCKIQAPEPARRPTLPPSGSRDQRRPPIHTSMHAESFPTQREEKRHGSSTDDSCSLAKRNIFPSSLLSFWVIPVIFPGPAWAYKKGHLARNWPRGPHLPEKNSIWCVCVILASSVWQQQAWSNERLPCIDHVLVGTLATEFFSIVAEKSVIFPPFLSAIWKIKEVGPLFSTWLFASSVLLCVFLDFSRPDFFLVRIRGIRAGGVAWQVSSF